jgi:pimeloyl-ACP methyl ester carboxylesterase
MQFPDLPVEKIHGTGHWLMMDKPDEFNRILADFLKRIQ